MKMQWLVGVAATAVTSALTGPAWAVALTLLPGAGTPFQSNVEGPQSAANPCIIAGTQCQQPAGFGFNNFTSAGNISAFNMFSTTPTATVADGVQGTPYTGAQLNAVAPIGFNVAIDVNSTQAAGETLQLFQVIVNGVVRDQFTGPAAIPPGNNGNGFGDYALHVVAPFAATDQVPFHAVWNKAVDRAAPVSDLSVQGPIAGAGLPGLVMACGGLLALARRRRQQIA